MIIRQRPVSESPAGVSVGPIANGEAASVSICGYPMTAGTTITRVALVPLGNNGAVPYTDKVTLHFSKANPVFKGAHVTPLSLATHWFIKY